MKIVKTIHVIGFSLLLPRLFLPHPFSINKQKKIKVQEVLVSETSTHWLPKVQRSWDRGPRSRVRKLVSHVPARTSIYIYICMPIMSCYNID